MSQKMQNELTKLRMHVLAQEAQIATLRADVELLRAQVFKRGPGRPRKDEADQCQPATASD